MASPLPARPDHVFLPAPVPLPIAERTVYLTIRIPPPQILNLFLALFERFSVRILSVGEDTTVQVQLPASQLDSAMDAVMQALPRAEFGPIGPRISL